jgi:hypothetical protein
MMAYPSSPAEPTSSVGRSPVIYTNQWLIFLLDLNLMPHTFLNDLIQLATMSDFLNSTDIGRDFKRQYQRKYTNQEKKRPFQSFGRKQA